MEWLDEKEAQDSDKPWRRWEEGSYGGTSVRTRRCAADRVVGCCCCACRACRGQMCGGARVVR